eukprot:Blabericola_migrator_1__8372@NODE_435_length_8501_cov_292_016244_g341_i0_p4_GENE_NODE_435_length_8501_cov_292_016244_g341_i0NODE_435_length_8501_cov_292_016244_g341_i0_p4_ORF_typecomplete_len312_score32_37zfRanBP/PF00641_18/2_8e12zfRanBP/PF00641_18/1_6e09DUF35_N/PF12172_8/0_1DUF35_N/PF12172_8/0_63DUF35_N/PF12172_8/6_8e02DZR/PF12773_7/0_25DZR/PF12773_7/0_032Cytochrom_c3_2/PF14537_6/3_3Cytochrom_c3_2/PF14537_6/83zincribbon_6/PF10005_9/0_92zincribbon_6/PF10005_9/66zinc_ribbon_11/PF11682_8/4zinc_rib
MCRGGAYKMTPRTLAMLVTSAALCTTRAACNLGVIVCSGQKIRMDGRSNEGDPDIPPITRKISRRPDSRTEASGVNDAIRPAPPMKRMKEGDWQCVSCGNVNFAKRTRCNKCGDLKPKVQANPAETAEPAPTSPVTGDVNSGDPGARGTGPAAGLFKKGDWTCTSCGNVNWARRDRCNLCIALKPSLQKDADAKRTGKAGGHFDLQDPADRLDYDSDDEEFDEFGRKKRRKASSRSVQPLPNNTTESTISQPTIKLVFPPAPISESDTDDEDPRGRGRRSRSPQQGDRWKGAYHNKRNQQTQNLTGGRHPI